MIDQSLNKNQKIDHQITIWIDRSRVKSRDNKGRHQNRKSRKFWTMSQFLFGNFENPGVAFQKCLN